MAGLSPQHKRSSEEPAVLTSEHVTKAAFAAGVSSALAGKEGTGVGRE